MFDPWQSTVVPQSSTQTPSWHAPRSHSESLLHALPGAAVARRPVHAGRTVLPSWLSPQVSAPHIASLVQACTHLLPRQVRELQSVSMLHAPPSAAPSYGLHAPLSQ